MLRNATRNGLLLTGFAAVATALIAVTQFVTADRIAAVATQQRLASLNRLFPESSYDNDLAASCIALTPDPLLGPGAHHAYIARLNGQASGIALEATAPDGYSGEIRFLVGADIQHHITGMDVVAHQETPGLGDKIERRRTNWLDSFIGRGLESDPDPRFAVKKDGGDIDQFTGATITPRAVVNGTANALRYLAREQESLIARQPDCGGSR